MTLQRPPLCMRHLCILASLYLSVQAHAQEPNADIYGHWRIKEMIGFGAVGSLSERQVRHLIGKPVLISAEKFEFNGQTCIRPTYQRSTDETVSHFYREWRTAVDDIPLPNPVTIIETGCDFLYLIRKDHIMIAEGGVFFEAVRINRKATKSARRGRQ